MSRLAGKRESNWTPDPQKGKTAQKGRDDVEENTEENRPLSSETMVEMKDVVAVYSTDQKTMNYLEETFGFSKDILHTLT